MSLTKLSKWIGICTIAAVSYQIYAYHSKYQSCRSLMVAKEPSAPNTKQRKRKKLQKLIKAFISQISIKPAYRDIIEVIALYHGYADNISSHSFFNLSAYSLQYNDEWNPSYIDDTGYKWSMQHDGRKQTWIVKVLDHNNGHKVIKLPNHPVGFKCDCWNTNHQIEEIYMADNILYAFVVYYGQIKEYEIVMGMRPVNGAIIYFDMEDETDSTWKVLKR